MSFTIFSSEKTTFYAIKTRSSTSRKIDIFSNRLTHGFRPKMAIFPTFFLQAIQARKMSFTIFSSEKTSVYAIKTRSSKGRKFDKFPKGLTHVFGRKITIFPTFIFNTMQARKMSFTIFQSEKTPYQAIKTRSSKSRKIDIVPFGLTHGFGTKMAILPTFLFQVIQARKMSFTIFQREKTTFQSIKTRSSKTRKIDIFPKRLTHGFGRKIAIFQIVFFKCNIDQENVFYDILERKNDFLRYKNKKFKKSKKLAFFQRVKG